jgi:acetyl-CoA carboxylase biotin carboxyl carrier protein
MSDLPFNAEDVAQIVAILDNTPYDRLDVRTGSYSLRLVRRGNGFTQELEVAGVAVAVASEVAPAPVAESEGITAIRSPLPGTFYRAPQPGAAPFVQPDTVIAIIETMKLMTSVTAGCAGIIAEIAVEDTKLVDAGAVLMRVRAV